MMYSVNMEVMLTTWRLGFYILGLVKLMSMSIWEAGHKLLVLPLLLTSILEDNYIKLLFLTLILYLMLLIPEADL